MTALNFFLLTIALGFVFLYLTKPQQVVKTEYKERTTHECNKLSESSSRNVCVAGKACKEGGGTLKEYKEDFVRSPIFSCNYKK